MSCHRDTMGYLWFGADRFSAFRSLATVSSGFLLSRRLSSHKPLYQRIYAYARAYIPLPEDIGVYPRINRLIYPLYLNFIVIP
jgi:hypothetical protein